MSMPIYAKNKLVKMNSVSSDNWLEQTNKPTHFYSTKVFMPPLDKTLDSRSFEVELEIKPIIGSELFRILKDKYNVSSNRRFKTRELPEIRVGLIRYGENIIPSLRGVQSTQHPYWDWQISPGKIWREKNTTNITIVLPFSLQEKNANCTHNGLMLLRFNKDNKKVQGFFQIGSETCSYYQFNLASPLKIKITSTKVANDDQLVQDYILEKKNKLHTYSRQNLKTDFPKLNVVNLMPPYIEGSTMSGVVIKNKHYQLNCQTRFGKYPFCDQLALPSYSTAKSIFAGIGTMRMEHIYPGIRKVLVNKVIPQCQSRKWNNVILDDLINMRTGNYLSRTPHKDEASKQMYQFFISLTDHEKTNLACNMFPHKAPPGKTMVYHTSDTYLAGVMLNRLLKKITNNSDKDSYQDLFVNDLWRKLKLSPLLNNTRRTYDDVKQPFTGWGLTYHIDDIIKISHFLEHQLSATDGAIVLDRKMLKSALQVGENRINRDGAEAGIAYNNGFWALEVSRALHCKKPKWIPFMSGFGGITVALVSKDILYYNFSDNNKFLWLKAIKELNRQFPICEE